MNQIKIGKFIKERRTLKNLTQSDLSQMLNVTDRAVSKWECGKCLPDASIMIDLCDILSISVNELLNGELINKNDYDSKYQKLLLEFKKEEEKNNKNLMMCMWSILVVTVAFFIETIILCIKNNSDIFWIILSLFIFFIGTLIAVKIEYDSGYYECKKCKYTFKPEFIDVLFSQHLSTSRKLNCPKCNKKTWSKKVMTK